MHHFVLPLNVAAVGIISSLSHTKVLKMSTADLSHTARILALIMTSLSSNLSKLTESNSCFIVLPLSLTTTLILTFVIYSQTHNGNGSQSNHADNLSLCVSYCLRWNLGLGRLILTVTKYFYSARFLTVGCMVQSALTDLLTPRLKLDAGDRIPCLGLATICGLFVFFHRYIV